MARSTRASAPRRVAPHIGYAVGRLDRALRREIGALVAPFGLTVPMWSHPVEVAAAFREGGWSPEAIAANWQATVGAAEQGYGVQLPPLDLEASA